MNPGRPRMIDKDTTLDVERGPVLEGPSRSGLRGGTAGRGTPQTTSVAVVTSVCTPAYLSIHPSTCLHSRPPTGLSRLRCPTPLEWFRLPDPEG